MARPMYIKHLSNARQDERMLALRMRLGWEGYGLYWGIVEILSASENYECVKDYNRIAFDLRVGANIVKSLVEDFGLFTFTEDGKRFYSDALSKDNTLEELQELAVSTSDAVEDITSYLRTLEDEILELREYVSKNEAEKELARKRRSEAARKAGLASGRARQRTNVERTLNERSQQEKVPLSSPHKETEERSPIPPKEVKEIYPPIIPPKESARRGQCARTHEEGAKGNFGEVVGAEVNTPSANISAGAEKEKSCAKKEREWELDLPAEVNYYPREEERILSQASDYAEVSRGAEEDSYPQATRGDFATVMSWWNMNIAKGHITVVSELTRTRRYKLIERIAEWRTKSQGGSLGETLSRIEKQIEASSLLRGDKGRWVITFDWLIADDTNWVKVLEGNYNDNTNNNKNGTGDRYANRRGREGAVASAESFAKWDGKF